MLSLNWSSSFLPCGADDVLVGFGVSAIFLPLSGGACIIIVMDYIRDYTAKFPYNIPNRVFIQQAV
jgi:hypothetical protein